MNWLQFIRLMHSIYGSGKPDIEWIQKLGLLAVKIGQVHALRIDFLDRETCEELAKLYRHTTALPTAELDRLLEQNLTAEVRGKFAEIDREPLASASVGQVHRARLNSGEEVVVKLVKGDFRERFFRDVASVRRLFRFVTFFYPKLRQVGDPVGILNDIEEYTGRELDLRNEVQGQQTLRQIYEDNRDRFDLSALRFARIYEDLSNENVMVSEYIAADSYDELLERGELPYERLLDLFKIHGFCMFIVGTFHGDIHPGNILFRDGKVCFVDTGYIGQVNDKLRTGLFAFFDALSKYDYPACAVALNRMSENEIAGEDFDRFREKFIELYADFTDAKVSKISLTTKMMHTIKLGVHSGMVFERGIFAIIRSLMYLDGMVLRCNPDAVVMHDMRRFLAEFQDLRP